MGPCNSGTATFQHAPNEATVTIQRSAKLTDGGYRQGYRETWTIAGMLQADNQADLQVAINSLEEAYSVDGRDLVLGLNEGGVGRVLTSADSDTGTVVVQGPDYPEGGETQGAEYGTVRHYRIVVEATYLLNINIVSFIETVSSEGTGGPRFVFLQPLVGPPQKQQVAQATPCRARQAGSIVGLYAYPAVTPPLWPDAEHQDQRRITYKTPKRVGPISAPYFINFQVDYEYAFEDSGPLVSLPNRWPA